MAEQGAVVAHLAVVEVAQGLGEVQLGAVFGHGALRILVIQCHLQAVEGPPLQRGEGRVALIVLADLAVHAAAGRQVIRRPRLHLRRGHGGAVAAGAHHLVGVAGRPGGAAAHHLFRVGAFQPLQAERHPQLAGPAQIELVQVADGAAPTHAIGVAQLAVAIGIGRPPVQLHAALAEFQRPHGLHVDRAGDAAFDEVGALGLVDRHGVDEFGRELVEVHRAVAAAVAGLAPVEGGRAQERPQATDGDLRRATLFAVRGRTGDGLDRLADRQRRQVADVLGRQHVGHHRLLALAVDGRLDRAADAGDLDLVQRGGRLLRCLLGSIALLGQGCLRACQCNRTQQRLGQGISDNWST